MINRFQYLQQLLEASPTDSFLLFAMAKECEGQGEASNALDYYLRLQEADPNYVGLYYHLGKLYENLGNDQKAILTYKKGIDISRNAGDQHAASELSGALLNLADPDDE